MSELKRCGFPVHTTDSGTRKCEGSPGHTGRCWATYNKELGAIVLASGEESGKILEDNGYNIHLCPDCDMLLPHGAPPGRCDRCEFEFASRRSAQPHDPVDRPEHYNLGDVECIDGIRSMLGGAAFRQYCRGQVMKYVWRAPYKGGYEEDLKKALFYLRFACGEDPRK